MNLNIEAAVRTHTGRIRANNEDNFFLDDAIREDVTVGESRDCVSATDRWFLAAVADGMGQEERGELASLITVENLYSCPFHRMRETALDCVQQANRQICDEIEEHGGGQMGSTLAALYIDKGKALCCNVGDSRVYLLRDGRFTKLSVDHNRAHQLVSLGVLTPEQAESHPSRHQLTQYLGIFEEEMLIEPAFSQVIVLKPGDQFLLCSDGLTDMVTEEEIADRLKEGGDPESQVEDLVNLALEHGGRDNVTALVVQVHSPGGLLGWLKRRRESEAADRPFPDISS